MATQFAVDLIFKSQGLGKLDGSTRQLSKLDQAAKKAQGSLGNASNNINRFGNSAQRAGAKAQAAARGVSKLKAAIAGIGFGLLAKSVFNASAEFERYEMQLKTLTGSAGRAKKVIEELDKVNRKSPFDLPQLIRTSKTLSAMGIKYENLVDTTERLGKISAATGARVEEVALAYGQVAAKGKLQTEELYQFQERGIALGEELKRMLGLTGEELQDMISKGRIGFPLVQKAIENLTGETGQFKDAFENTANTLDAKLSNMQSDFKIAAAALGDAFRPVFIWLLEQATKLANFITGVIAKFQRGQAGVEATEKANSMADDLTRKKYGQMGLATMAFNPEVRKFWENARKSVLDNLNRQIDIDQGRRIAAPQIDAVPKAAASATAAEVQKNRELLLSGNAKTGGSGSGSGSIKSAFKLSSKGKALVNAANKLGISPLDLATIIEFESGGSPSIVGGAGGNYQGLIQFGPPERKQYGMHRGQSFEEQVQGPVVRFLQDRFSGVGRSTQGASLADLYATVLGGNPNANKNAQDSFGTSVNSAVRDKFPAARQSALNKYFGGDEANIGYDQADNAQNLAAAYQIVAQNAAQAREQITQIGNAVKLQTTDLEQQLELEQQRAELLAGTNSTEEIERKLQLAQGLQELDNQRLTALQGLQEITNQNFLADEEIKAKEEEITAEFEKQKSLLEQLQGLRNQNADAATARGAAERQATANNGQTDSGARGIAGTIAGGLKNALVTAIKGGDVKEAFAQLAEGLANKFLDIAFKQIEDAIFNAISPQQTAAVTQAQASQGMGMAAQTQAVAAQNMLAAAQMMASLGGGGGGFNLGGLGGLFSPGGSIGSFGSTFGSSFSGGFGAGFFGFADGGFVNSATPALVGEGGSNEYIIPENKMGSAMQRWNAGARGDAVTDGAAVDSIGGGMEAAEQPAQINISGGVMQFGEDDYIRKDQLPTIISQAGKQGEQRALRKLQMSQSTRRKIGM